MCAYFPAQSGWIDEVDECPLPVDLHHREPFPVLGLEASITRDVDLLESCAALLEHASRTLAEVAALRVVQDDSGSDPSKWSSDSYG